MFVVALVTPKTLNRWDKKEIIDYQSFYRLTDYLSLFFDNFLFLGFTGEFYNLSLEEAEGIIKFAEEFKFRKKDKKIIINVTRKNFEETMKLIEKSDFSDFLMIIFPYNDISYEDGIRIIKKTKKKFIFYYSKLITDLTNEKLEEIIKQENVIGIKDSIFDNSLYQEKIKLVEKYNKKYFCGIDKIWLNEFKNGKNLDLISGTLNFIPHLWKKGEYSKIEKIVNKIEEIEKYIPFPHIAKYCLSVSPPFYPLINENLKFNEEQIKKLKELEELYKEIIYKK
ncbi:MAG: dihydrodipicolinate synthase family protein [Candidatus Pacearchaeota archaeon]